jgi:hypothetical protein
MPEWFREYLGTCLRRHSAGLALRVHLMPETGLLALYAYARERLAPPWSAAERVTPESLAALLATELRRVGLWGCDYVERVRRALRDELTAAGAPRGCYALICQPLCTLPGWASHGSGTRAM